MRIVRRVMPFSFGAEAPEAQMAEESNGLAQSVRRRLDEGASADVVIEELVAKGLSRGTAQRFVDRALAESTPPALPPTPAPDWIPSTPIPTMQRSEEAVSLTDLMHNPDAIAQAQAFRDLSRGMIAASIGLAFTMLTFVFSSRPRLGVGLIAGGVWLLGRGIVRCTNLEGPFPWTRVLTACVTPILTTVVLLGYASWHEASAREKAEKARAAAELAAADRSRADQIRAESAQTRARANRERAAEVGSRLSRALAQLDSNQPISQCDAALELGRSGSKEYVPRLLEVLSSAKYRHTWVCAAGALVTLGETSAPMAAYLQWSVGDDPDLRRAAIGGFGDIGPAAAEAALPFLRHELNSPHMDARYVVVDSLAKLGPAAHDLLVVATADPDPLVRGRANAALKASPVASTASARQ
jgi:HEAT repeat protein